MATVNENRLLPASTGARSLVGKPKLGMPKFGTQNLERHKMWNAKIWNAKIWNMKKKFLAKQFLMCAILINYSVNANNNCIEPFIDTFFKIQSVNTD